MKRLKQSTLTLPSWSPALRVQVSGFWLRGGWWATSPPPAGVVVDMVLQRQSEGRSRSWCTRKMETVKFSNVVSYIQVTIFQKQCIHQIKEKCTLITIDSQHMTKHLPNVLSPDIFKELVQLQGRKLRKSEGQGQVKLWANLNQQTSLPPYDKGHMELGHSIKTHF